MAHETIRVETVDDLISWLRPSHRRWRKGRSRWKEVRYPQSSWVFRGHGDERWSLLPSAWRQPRAVAHEAVRRHATAVVAQEVRAARRRLPTPKPHFLAFDESHRLTEEVVTEHMMVNDFVRLADELGFEVPAYQPTISALRELEDPIGEAAHAVEALASMSTPRRAHSIAQHHGIPTRLLDWTREPMYAGFFAAESALRKRLTDDPPRNFVIYALHTRRMRESGYLQALYPNRSQGQFIHAQAGIFTFDTSGDGFYFHHDRWPSLEESIGEPSSGPALVRILAPLDLAGRVMEVFTDERISRAHLMPTFDNVGRTLLQRWEAGIGRATD